MPVKLIYCVLLTTSLVSCTKNLYRKALTDAARPTPGKVSTNLTTISKDNTTLCWKQFKNKDSVPEDFVLVASWKKDTTFYHNNPATGFYNTQNFPLFATVIPDLQHWYEQSRQKGKMDKRLAQLLGLPPDTHYTAFVLFWVRPQDIIRPCLDTEITDSTCDFVMSTKSNIPQNCDNLVWLIEYTRQSYSSDNPYQRYPFTQLGYTYDWNRKNKRHIGLSEFVVGKNKDVKVAAIYKTNQFFKIACGDISSY